MNPKITVTIITLNEEELIGACIESAWKIADEVIVVDSYSADKTREIAEHLGANVYLQKFVCYGLQKDYAAQKAKHDWVLNMDADERLDDRMIEVIKGLDLDGTTHDAYAFPRKNYIGPRWQKVWSPDFVIRLYNKQRCHFSHPLVHESLMTRNYKTLESGHIIHYSFKDLSDSIIRADKYSKLDAKALFENNRKVSNFAPALHGAVTFVKYYFLKKGIVYGLDGLTGSLISALRSYLKYVHLIEMHQNTSLSNPDRHAAGQL